MDYIFIFLLFISPCFAKSTFTVTTIEYIQPSKPIHDVLIDNIKKSSYEIQSASITFMLKQDFSLETKQRLANRKRVIKKMEDYRIKGRNTRGYIAHKKYRE